MKILSIAIPCYNSAAYMEKCINSLLVGGEDVEILIVDDGSTKDNTAAIADDYAARYPSIIKAIHQENGGHGEAVNTGIRNATGVFFKVVDSDDWVNETAYKKLLSTMKYMIANGTELDLLISNYVYEKEGAKRKKVISYRNALPVEELFTWDEVKHFRIAQYILMHSVIYRTQLLKDCALELPKHTFYVDNIFVFHPLPYVKTMYYVDVNFYRYYIGRSDQSVNEKVMISRVDQQLRVNYLMLDYYCATKIENKHCRRYMLNYLKIMMVISSVMLILSETDENFQKKKELWRYVYVKNPKLWVQLRCGILGCCVNIPGKGGRKVTKTGYKIANKFIGFN
ncbi:MAG: glycosyltransferase family 2 protein [Thermoflexaceae bacterium]|nr:glycosyltransferase family 2 protein [Thermoflexaceae bacterium]